MIRALCTGPQLVDTLSNANFRALLPENSALNHRPPSVLASRAGRRDLVLSAESQGVGVHLAQETNRRAPFGVGCFQINSRRNRLTSLQERPVNMRLLFSASAILVGLALSSSSAAIGADRCQVPSSDLLGLRGVDGKCVGVRRDIAARFLRIERSECAPAPRDGVKMFGRCIADDPKQAEDEAYLLADRALGEADGVFKNKMAEIRAEVDRQLADLSSKIEELRGKLRHRRPDRENETLGL